MQSSLLLFLLSASRLIFSLARCSGEPEADRYSGGCPVGSFWADCGQSGIGGLALHSRHSANDSKADIPLQIVLRRLFRHKGLLTPRLKAVTNFARVRARPTTPLPARTRSD